MNDRMKRESKGQAKEEQRRPAQEGRPFTIEEVAAFYGVSPETVASGGRLVPWTPKVDVIDASPVMVFGHVLPDRLSARWADSPDDPICTLEVRVLPTGRPVCTKLTLESQRGGRPVSTGMLRRIPIERAIRAAIGKISDEFEVGADGKLQNRQPEFTADVTPADSPEVFSQKVKAGLEAQRDQQVAQGKFAERFKGSGRRRLITPELLKQVAEIYRAEPGYAKRRAVQEALGLTGSTASRYIKMAVEAGTLGKAPGQGKAGEDDPILTTERQRKAEEALHRRITGESHDEDIA